MSRRGSPGETSPLPQAGTGAGDPRGKQGDAKRPKIDSNKASLPTGPGAGALVPATPSGASDTCRCEMCGRKPSEEPPVARVVLGSWLHWHSSAAFRIDWPSLRASNSCHVQREVYPEIASRPAWRLSARTSSGPPMRSPRRAGKVPSRRRRSPRGSCASSAWRRR